jgi:hypothetical protein
VFAKALASKTEFTLEEWKTFGITDLDNDSSILSDCVYFKPAARVMRGRRRSPVAVARKRPAPAELGFRPSAERTQTTTTFSHFSAVQLPRECLRFCMAVSYRTGLCHLGPLGWP